LSFLLYPGALLFPFVIAVAGAIPIPSPCPNSLSRRWSQF
jgi:hypothetical protein